MEESMALETFHRRGFLAGALATCVPAATGAAAATTPPPVARLILDNDFSGDPDGLYQLAHHVLSPSVDIELVVGSHLPGFSRASSVHTATDAASSVRELLRVMKRDGAYRVMAGAESAIASRTDWRPSPATDAIVREALREDGRGPLVYAAGAGLTEVALAWLAEPRIGKRLKLVWIGGGEHPGLALPPPGPAELEFNYTIDPIAARIVFNESDIEIWQVPRDAYRRMLVSMAELRELAKLGPTAEYLYSRLEGIKAYLANAPAGVAALRAETYVLGDSPLVTLSALHTVFQPDPASSTYTLLPTPKIDESGRYRPDPQGRPMRVYSQIDTRLTFADLAAKLRSADAPAGRRRRP